MFAKAGVLMLVEASPIVSRQAVSILGKMPGHPVQNYADTLLMAAIDEIAELIRISVPAGRGIEVDDLIAPGAIKGMFHHGQQLDMREAQFLYIRDETIAKFDVAKVTIPFLRISLP
jgi:hypothetical protein